MILLFIKIWIQNRVMFSHHRKTNAPRGHVQGAVDFSKAINRLNEISLEYNELAENATDYAEHMLGLYTLNHVANLPYPYFKKVMNQVPQFYRHDKYEIVNWVGRKAMDHSSVVLWSNFSDAVVEEVFDLKNLPLAGAGWYTKVVLDLLDNRIYWNKIITIGIERQIMLLDKEVDMMVFTNDTSNRLEVLRRLHLIKDVAIDYNLSSDVAVISKLIKTADMIGV